VAATVLQERQATSQAPAALSAYAGFPGRAATATLSAPLVAANNWGHTGIQVQNAGTQETQVTVRYGPNTATTVGPGADRLCGQPAPSAPRTLPPGGSATFQQAAGDPGQGLDQQFARCT
jgi:hypothetical protein